MVLDSLRNANTYISLNPLFKQAFDFISKNNLSGFDPGKIVLDGDRLYISVMEIEGKTAQDAKLETHKKYIDIQVIITGEETMGWTALEHCKNEIEPYNAEKDIVFYSDLPTTNITVKPGEFVIFFPEDGHAPAIGKGFIKKAVVKVLA